MLSVVVVQRLRSLSGLPFETLRDRTFKTKIYGYYYMVTEALRPL